MAARLEIALLGPLEVRLDGARVDLRSRPQRIVLARLALSPGRPVPVGDLVDALWDDRPPANAAGNLQSYISRLRHMLGADRIVLEAGGYRLAVDDEHVDAGRVERLAAEVRAILGTDPRRAAELLSTALSCWRGEALADMADVLALGPPRTRLTAERRHLHHQLLALRLAVGEAAAVLPELESATLADPHDEQAHCLYIRGLHHVGRTAEALRVGADLRRRLRDEVGLDPSPALADLERDLLAGFPAGAIEGRATDESIGSDLSWPRFATPLLGRQRELTTIDVALDTERLVTLTGTGGVGKTRLAAEAVERQAALGLTVLSVPLATVSPSERLDEVLAGAIGLRIEPGRNTRSALRERLGAGRHVLVLDNCEHVVDAVRDLVDALLSTSSELRVLTTSRVSLGLAAEQVVRIGPLDMPAGGHDGDHPAIQLFVERGRRVRPGWDPQPTDLTTIGSIVDRLGALPLAIELAAGRLSSLSLDDLAARLDGALDLVAGARPSPDARHRSLRATLDWSYDLLGDGARRLLRFLSGFPDGADLAAVETLAGDLGLAGAGTLELAGLVDASVLDADLAGTSRYTMLEPIRLFARARLDDEGEADAAGAALARWARDRATSIASTCRGPDEARGDRNLRRELRNLRAAHVTARQAGDLDTAIDISAALRVPSTARDLPDVWSWALDLADDPQLSGHPRHAEALGAAAQAAWLNGDLDRSERLARQGLSRDGSCLACLDALGSVELFRGAPERAIEAWSSASEQDPGVVGRLALAAAYAGEATLAGRLAEQGRRWAAEHGPPSDLAFCHYSIGELLAPGTESIEHYARAAALAAGVGATFVEAVTTVGLASVHASAGRYGEALDEYAWLVRYWTRTGNWTQQWTTLRNLATLLDALDDAATAALLLGAADAADEAAAVRPQGRPAQPSHSSADRPSRTDVVAAGLAAIDRARAAA